TGSCGRGRPARRSWRWRGSGESTWSRCRRTGEAGSDRGHTAAWPTTSSDARPGCRSCSSAARRVVLLNRRARELLGRPARLPATTAEIRARLRATDPDGAPVERLAAELALAGRVVDREAWTAVAGEPPRRLHVRATPMRAGDGRVVGAVSVWRDI